MSPQSKTFKVSSLLDSKGTLVMKAPLLDYQSVHVGINLSGGEVEINLLVDLCGHVVVGLIAF